MATREYGSKRWIEIDVSAALTKLCTQGTTFMREVSLDDVTDGCSNGANEQEPMIRTWKVDGDGVFDSTSDAYQELIDSVDTKSPGDAGYCKVTANYVTPTYTYAGSFVFTSISEAAPVGSMVRFTISGGQFTGTVTRSATT